MSRADFYVLPQNQLSDRLYFCCRLVEKALRNKLRVLLWLPDIDLAHKTDNLLWSYIPESFIPHVIVGESTSQQTEQAPILISKDSQPQQACDMLINLRNDTPAWANGVERIAEIVIQDENVLNSTRHNYSFYRQQGYNVTTHKIGS